MDLSHCRTIRLAATDLNGQMRGKRVPVDYAEKLTKSPVRMPYSACNVDVFGYDIEDSPLVFDSGDADCMLLPIDRGLMPMPWLEEPQALVMMQMYHEDGRIFEGDARGALQTVIDRFTARGLSVIAATELEFTLVDDRNGLQAAADPRTGRAIEIADVLSVSAMDAFDPFISAVYHAADQMGIAIQTTTKEGGLGQFEITLQHREAMRAADDTWLLKALIKGMARKFGFAATFMAKPLPGEQGNGLHLHFSVQDDNGQNVFDNGRPEGTDMLRAGIAGCLQAMHASTLIFAPHANSYLRLEPENHAPTSVCWGYDNRTVAVRVPGGAPAARRIEHRVAGGDVNPYLMFATVLGSAIAGIEVGLRAPDPVTGNAYAQELPQLATDWESAITAFENSDEMAALFHADLIQYLCMCKRQERRLMAERPIDQHWKIYLETV